MEYTPPSGYRVINNDESDRLPANWKLLESNKGRKVYETPPPRTLIQTRKQLSDFQKSGRYLELDPSQVNFLIKQKIPRKTSFHFLQNINSGGGGTGASGVSGTGSTSGVGTSSTGGGGTASSVEKGTVSFGEWELEQSAVGERLEQPVVEEGELERVSSGGGGAGTLSSRGGGAGILSSGGGASGTVSSGGGGAGTVSSGVGGVGIVSSHGGGGGTVSSSEGGGDGTVSSDGGGGGTGTSGEGGWIETDLGGNSLECGAFSRGEGTGPGVAVSSSPNDGPSKIQQKKIDHDIKKISAAVKRLTVDPEIVVDHKLELLSAAKLLSNARSPGKQQEFSFERLKEDVSECSSLDSMCQLLWEQVEARSYFKEMQNSTYLEEMMHIGRSYVEGPMKTFPPNINKNVYADIIRFSLEHCCHTVLFLVNLVVQKDKPVTTDDVIREAFKEHKKQ